MLVHWTIDLSEDRPKKLCLTTGTIEGYSRKGRIIISFDNVNLVGLGGVRRFPGAREPFCLPKAVQETQNAKSIA